jgi:hypothetical protein
LVAVEFVYNNSVQASTPFYLSYSWHPYTPLLLLNPSSRAGGSESADQCVVDMQERISTDAPLLSLSSVRSGMQTCIVDTSLFKWGRRCC